MVKYNGTNNNKKRSELRTKIRQKCWSIFCLDFIRINRWKYLKTMHIVSKSILLWNGPTSAVSLSIRFYFLRIHLGENGCLDILISYFNNQMIIFNWKQRKRIKSFVWITNKNLSIIFYSNCELNSFYSTSYGVARAFVTTASCWLPFNLSCWLPFICIFLFIFCLCLFDSSKYELEWLVR